MFESEFEQLTDRDHLTRERGYTALLNIFTQGTIECKWDDFESECMRLIDTYTPWQIQYGGLQAAHLAVKFNSSSAFIAALRSRVPHLLESAEARVGRSAASLVKEMCVVDKGETWGCICDCVLSKIEQGFIRNNTHTHTHTHTHTYTHTYTKT
eukprot:GHVR01093318.1.p1 GENE.GHVR01093318.1~~GHVR01093318.1.p1  ORF type:complete len:154 (+),score=77.31 GHVR01093318.1:50-511(+)